MDMDIDLSTHVAGALGISLAQLGTYLLYLVMLAPLISWLRPHVEPALVRWRQAALLTSSSVDDTAVALLSRLWSVLLLVPVVVLQAVPVFTKAVEAARKGPPKRPGAVLGLLLCGILLAGALVATSGCATGRGSDTTPLHRASTAASVLVDTGVFVAAELEREIREETTEVFEACLAAAEPGRNCGLVAAARAGEYRILSAAHNAYATAVNAYRDELEAAARRAETGEDPDLRDAIRLGARALATYDTLAELLQLAGIPAPPLPEGVRRSVEALQ